jgi:8-oxo-dGTP pyrophosphatase MutT (NUDIX family)
VTGPAKKTGKPASKAPIEYHHSAGGLVMLEDKILLISTRQGRRWQLPKGHLEPGETSEQAAIREIQEETGVLGRIVHTLPHVRYSFVERGRRIRKRVDYYLLDYVEGDPANYDREEVSGAAWFPWEHGVTTLSFDNERRVVETAWDWIRSKASATAGAAGASEEGETK